MVVNPEFPEGGVPNSGRHRAPDGDAQTAYIPRLSDAAPDGVPGGPLDPPVGLGQSITPPPAPPSPPPPAAASPAPPAAASSAPPASGSSAPPASGSSAPPASGSSA